MESGFLTPRIIGTGLKTPAPLTPAITHRRASIVRAARRNRSGKFLTYRVVESASYKLALRYAGCQVPSGGCDLRAKAGSS